MSNKIFNYISQKGQDKWIIEDIFNFKKNGYFVDLAATDGIKINNTLILERELNWKGICIEPNPIYYKELVKNRICNNTNICVDMCNNNSVEFRIDNGELGGIVDVNTDNNYVIRGDELKNAKVITIKTKTLDYILDKFNAPKVIDYLSLDIEGSEERALINFPFSKYTFLALTIERPTINLENKLFENGYFFVKKYSYDSFYIHKSIPNFNEIEKSAYSPTPKKNW